MGLAMLSAWNWSLRNEGCFKQWAHTQQPSRTEFLLTKRESKPGRTTILLRLPHVPGPTRLSLYYRKFASEFAGVANPGCGGNKWSEWAVEFISPFLDLAFYLGLLIFQTLCWGKQMLLLLVWGKGGHNKRSFRNCSFIAGKMFY